MAEVSQADVLAAGWWLKLGVDLFGLSIALPVLGVPLVAAMGLSAATVATVSGVMLVGAEVLGILAVAVMGKSGYAYVKNRVFGFLKQYGPPAEVSRTRYTIGLVMFAVPIVFGWLAPYAADLVPGYQLESTLAIVQSVEYSNAKLQNVRRNSTGFFADHTDLEELDNMPDLTYRI